MAHSAIDIGDCQLLWRQRPTIVFSINISENIPILRIFIISRKFSNFFSNFFLRISKILSKNIKYNSFVSVRFFFQSTVRSQHILFDFQTSSLSHSYQRALWQVQSARQSSGYITRVAEAKFWKCQIEVGLLHFNLWDTMTHHYTWDTVGFSFDRNRI